MRKLWVLRKPAPQSLHVSSRFGRVPCEHACVTAGNPRTDCEYAQAVGKRFTVARSVRQSKSRRFRVNVVH